MSSGHELAFRTRTCGPRTWFNFKTDVLYIDYRSYDESDIGADHSLLSGNFRWDIGQFEPQDLQKVRRLALQSAAQVVTRQDPSGLQEISNILELFTGIEELFLEEHGICDSDNFPRHRYPREDPERLWSYTSPKEVDILSSTFEHEDLVHSTGYGHFDLRDYKTEHMGDGSGYFVDAARRFEEQLTTRRDFLVRERSFMPWRIPKVRIEYITYPSACKKLFDWRWTIWYRFQGKKEEQGRLQAIEAARLSIDVPRRHIFDRGTQPPSTFALQFEDEEEVLLIAREDEYYGYEDSDAWDYQQRQWMINDDATILAPGV
ncbi:hypothetical protein ONZ43_g7047 [Nemania bipapillata]|uniref:Uncharacterized protein n=1 Tax=Nemania bipapillata TaxID=110536 RepID=A0ACC2HUR2_9PEZI|nr:hypothetical protein ONZ43_g7047 [Nemania bipapillata]